MNRLKIYIGQGLLPRAFVWTRTVVHQRKSGLYFLEAIFPAWLEPRTMPKSDVGELNIV
jgi:hypothetical protein